MKKIFNLILILTTSLILTGNAQAFVLQDFAVFGLNSVTVGGGSDVKGGLTGSHGSLIVAGASTVEGAAGAGTFQANNSASSFGNITYNGTLSFGALDKIDGDINASGKVTLGSGTVVNGNVISGNQIVKGVGVNITGTETQFGSPQPYIPITLPSAKVFSAGGSSFVNNLSGQTQILTPGSYGTLALTGFNNVIKLSAGQYYFDSFQLGSGGQIDFDLTGGDVELYVVGDMLWGNSVNASKIGGNNVYTEIHGKWTNSGGGNYYGTVYAPFDLIHISNGFDHEGTLYSGTVVDLEHNVTVNFTPIPEPLTMATFGAGLLSALRLRRKESVIS